MLFSSCAKTPPQCILMACLAWNFKTISQLWSGCILFWGWTSFCQSVVCGFTGVFILYLSIVLWTCSVIPLMSGNATSALWSTHHVPMSMTYSVAFFIAHHRYWQNLSECWMRFSSSSVTSLHCYVLSTDSLFIMGCLFGQMMVCMRGFCILTLIHSLSVWRIVKSREAKR